MEKQSLGDHSQDTLIPNTVTGLVFARSTLTFKVIGEWLWFVVFKTFQTLTCSDRQKIPQSHSQTKHAGLRHETKHLLSQSNRKAQGIAMGRRCRVDANLNTAGPPCPLTFVYAENEFMGTSSKAQAGVWR